MLGGPPGYTDMPAPTFALLRPLSASRPSPKFMVSTASEPLLTALRLEGAPARTSWDPSRLEDCGHPLFRLRAMELPKEPPPKEKRSPLVPRKDGHQERRNLQELERMGFGSRGGAPGSLPQLASEMAKPEAESPGKHPPKNRAERYFQLLMKAHDQREQGWTDAILSKENAKKELAATRALQRAIEAEGGIVEETRPPSTASSLSSDQTGTKKEEEDSDVDEQVELQPYDGAMKLQIEVVVNRAPGEVERDDADSVDSSKGDGGEGQSKEGSDDGGSSDGERFNIEDELAALKEFADSDAQSDSVAGDKKIALKGKGIKNVWDAPDPRWALGIGGTVFFIPEAERYSQGPSLPPPPPPSLVGRRRIRLKPRLPLDISSGRYRDEHPNVWPEGVPAATAADRVRLERKLMTFEFYQGCSQSMADLRQPVNPLATPKRRQLSPEAAFGRSVWQHAQAGTGWETNRRRDQVKKKRQADRNKQIEFAEMQNAQIQDRKRQADEFQKMRRLSVERPEAAEDDAATALAQAEA